MARQDIMSRWSYLFFIPSFYGAVTWGVALILYSSRLIEWERNSTHAMAIFLLVEAAFILSVFLFAPLYKQWVSVGRSNDSLPERSYATKGLILLLHGIGFIGIARYVTDFSETFGGIEGFAIALFNQSYLIRWAAEDTSSIGTQLSYFGWIAISLTVLRVTQRRMSGWWLLICLFQVCANLVYIDRTRPIWIMFTSLLMVLLGLPKLKVSKVSIWAALAIVLGILIFSGVAEWIGKVPEEGTYGTSNLTPQAENLYFYITAGFPYFNRILEEQKAFPYVPERTFYPAAKILSALSLTEPPPSQVNEFEYVPFETNVGTFLEPLYRDGGFVFVIFGIIIHSFGLDVIGIQLLTRRTLFATYAWSNMCFVSFIGFFTPKLNTFPIWLFLGLGLVSICKQLLEFMRNKQVHSETLLIAR